MSCLSCVSCDVLRVVVAFSCNWYHSSHQEWPLLVCSTFQKFVIVFLGVSLLLCHAHYRLTHYPQANKLSTLQVHRPLSNHTAWVPKARRTKSSRPEGPLTRSRAWRAPQLLVYYIIKKIYIYISKLHIFKAYWFLWKQLIKRNESLLILSRLVRICFSHSGYNEGTPTQSLGPRHLCHIS